MSAGIDTALKAQAGASKETSDGDKSTESQTGVYAFQSKALYQNPLNPEEKITGEQLKAIVNRGTLFDKAQSDRDKARTEAERLAAENENLKTAKEKAEAALAKREEDARIAKTLQDMGIGKTKKQAEDWYDEEDDNKVTLSPQDISRIIKETTKEEITAAVAELQKLQSANQTQYFAKLQEQQETERFVAENVNSARRVAMQTLQAEMPDIESSEIEAALNMDTLATVKGDEARDALRNRDMDTWQVRHFEAEELRAKAINAMADLRLKQRAAAAEKEREAILESSSRGVKSAEIAAMMPTANKRKAKEQEAIRLREARKSIAAREAARNR